jgi:tryptophan-rich sensory protein
MELVVFISICLIVGGLGSVATTPAIPTWYAALKKPFFNPPNFLFAPVWTILYIIMGIAAYLVWKSGWERTDVKTALFFFGLQLALNGAWSPVFFGLRSPLLGLVVILMLWFSLLYVILLFHRISPLAAWLLVPYLLWVTFASALNYSIFVLNL